MPCGRAIARARHQWRRRSTVRRGRALKKPFCKMVMGQRLVYRGTHNISYRLLRCFRKPYSSVVVTWYRLMIVPGLRAPHQMHDLTEHVRSECSDRWSEVPREVAFVARYTQRGGYEVRFTERLHWIVSHAAPHHFIEECDPPKRRAAKRTGSAAPWSLQVGGPHWIDVLGIDPNRW